MHGRARPSFGMTPTVIRMEGAMATMSHSNFKRPIGKAQWRLCPITFLKHESRKGFIRHQNKSF